MFNLLVVDDEPLTRQFLKAHLTRLHPDWQFAGEAEDGRDALDFLASGGTRIDLVVTDIKMPVMDGLELARSIASLYPGMKVAILSGYDEFAMAKEAMRYGVTDYLLKPVVVEEFADLLEKVARRLEEESRSRLAHRALVNLSESTRTQIVGQFLKAVVTGNEAEIQSLYPLLYRMKVTPIEAEGAVLALDLDEGELLCRKAALSETGVFRYILHQTASELAERVPGAAVFFDGSRGTNLLVTGDDADEVADRCAELFGSIREGMAAMTSLNVWGAVGSIENETLQIGASYREARQRLKSRLFAGDTGLLFSGEGSGTDAALRDGNRLRIRKLDKAVAALRVSLAQPDDPGLAAAVRAYVDLPETRSGSALLRFGAYLIRSVTAGVEDGSIGRGSPALSWQILKNFADLESEDPASEDAVFSLFLRIAKPLAASPDPDAAAEGEHDSVRRAKAYILAHYREPLSLALLAEKVGVSPGYLSGLFLQSEEESYIKFLTKVRMDQAARMLLMKPAPKVYDVAEKVGYVSVKHFSNVFKRHYGVPPGEYQMNG